MTHPPLVPSWRLARSRLLRLFVFLGGPAAVVLVAAEAAKFSFNLPVDVLEKSVKRFAAQSGLEVLIPGDEVAEIRTQAVRGEMTSQDALDAMLAGTGLNALRDPKTGAFAVRKDAAGPVGSKTRKVGSADGLDVKKKVTLPTILPKP